MRIRTIIAALAAPLALGGVLLSATAASAATGPQQYVTHFNRSPDTSGLPLGMGATLSWAGGAVWALDNLAVMYKVIPQAAPLPDGANYVVDETVIGSFHGFADPVTGAALTSDGSVKGTFTWDVLSPVAPDGANLPSQEPAPTVNLSGGPCGYQLCGGAGDPDAIAQLFGGQGQIVGPPTYYSFSYQNGNYTQFNAPPYFTGDVKGH